MSFINPTLTEALDAAERASKVLLELDAFAHNLSDDHTGGRACEAAFALVLVQNYLRDLRAATLPSTEVNTVTVTSRPEEYTVTYATNEPDCGD